MSPIPDSIVIEGAYAGFSTIVLLKVPWFIWDQMPDCPATNLVGFSISGRFTPEMEARVDSTLAVKMGTQETPAEAAARRAAAATIAAAAAATAAIAPAPAPGSRFAPPTLAASPLLMDANVENLEQNVAEYDDGENYQLRASPKKARKALPSGRKLLPSERSPVTSVKKESKPTEVEGDEESREPPTPDGAPRKALPSARKQVKITMKSSGALYQCQDCNNSGFKDEESLANHVRKQHMRPFQCVYNWAGCDSTFASKNEWKRHVTSQHILLYYWICQIDSCQDKDPTSPSFAHHDGTPAKEGTRRPASNDNIFNRKDLYTQHLRRMHIPENVKTLARKAKLDNKPPSGPEWQKWEDRLRELQQRGIKERCKFPEYMRCPAVGCELEFNGANAWDDRMEHVAKHLEKAAQGKEPPVVFGGAGDPTLTEWSTRPDICIVKMIGPGVYQLDNPLRPEVLARRKSPPSREGSVIFAQSNFRPVEESP
jgi:uncharacterized C2H2 Zn-finger protein